MGSSQNHAEPCPLPHTPAEGRAGKTKPLRLHKNNLDCTTLLLGKISEINLFFRKKEKEKKKTSNM